MWVVSIEKGFGDCGMGFWLFWVKLGILWGDKDEIFLEFFFDEFDFLNPVYAIGFVIILRQGFGLYNEG